MVFLITPVIIFIKVVSVFMLKYGFKFMAIGFLGYLFISAGINSILQKSPDPFMKEFGGRILLVDRTIDSELTKLKDADMGLKDRIMIIFGVLLDLLMFIYIIKFIKWTFAGMMGPTVPDSIYIMFAIGIIFFAEMFYAKVYLDYWVIPFAGFVSSLANMYDLLISPIIEWFKVTFHISSLPTSDNETLSWWDRLFT